MLTAAVIHRGAVADEWWRLPTWRTFLWTLLEFLVLSLAGAAIAAGPTWTAWPAAALAGLFNARSWRYVIRASVLSRWEQPIPGLAIVPIVALVGLSVFAAATLFGQGAATTGDETPPDDRGGEPVLVIRGLGSQWDGTTPDLLGPPFTEYLYSYEGMADGTRLPYEAADTYRRSLFEYARVMEEQVTALHARTGEPIDIVADSEGTLVTQLYLAAHPHAPVEDVVLASPLVHPARVHYPPAGEDGWGVAGGWMWRGAMDLVRSLSRLGAEADSELARSIIDHAAIMRGLETCQFGPRTALIIPWAAASVAPYGLRAEPATQWVPATHAGILSDERVDRYVRRWLEGGPLPPTGTWGYVAAASRAVASGWHVPTVDLALVPAWQDVPSRAPGGLPKCDAIRQLVAEQVAELPDGDHNEMM